MLAGCDFAIFPPMPLATRDYARVYQMLGSPGPTSYESCVTFVCADQEMMLGGKQSHRFHHLRHSEQANQSFEVVGKDVQAHLRADVG